VNRVEINMAPVKVLAIPPPVTVQLAHPASKRKVTWLVVLIAIGILVAGVALILWKLMPGSPVQYLTELAAL
jgi:hypothetical protein